MEIEVHGDTKLEVDVRPGDTVLVLSPQEAGIVKYGLRMVRKNADKSRRAMIAKYDTAADTTAPDKRRALADAVYERLR